MVSNGYIKKQTFSHVHSLRVTKLISLTKEVDLILDLYNYYEIVKRLE